MRTEISESLVSNVLHVLILHCFFYLDTVSSPVVDNFLFLYQVTMWINNLQVVYHITFCAMILEHCNALSLMTLCYKQFQLFSFRVRLVFLVSMVPLAALALKENVDPLVLLAQLDLLLRKENLEIKVNHQSFPEKHETVAIFLSPY